MALKNIANEDLTLQITTPGVTGSISITSSPSTKVKANGKGVYRGPLSISVSNIIQSPCGTATPGTATATINPTASKVKAEGLFVIRVGDKVTGVSAIGATQPSPSGPQPCSITFDVEVTDAGQNKVKAE